MTQPNDAPFPPLTLRQRLWVLPIVATLPFAVAVGVFRENKGRSWCLAAKIAATRHMFGRNWDIYTIRSFMGATTFQAYQKWAHRERQQVVTDVLPEGAKLHWIGPRRDASQDRVFLYFHGGAYSIPARPECFPFLSALQKDVAASLGDIGIALLQYSLAPDSPFPTQLKQANAALTYLLNKGIPPANIIIGGDSAGGNLTLQLASHLLHPLSSIPAPPALPQPLAGAVLISPWTGLDVGSPSYARNNRKDIITASSYAFLGNFVKEGLSPGQEHYMDVVSAPPTWWQGLDSVFARILFTVGEHECPFDHILETSAVISRHVRDTVTFVDPGAVHEEVISKFGTTEGGSGKCYDTINAFLSRSFQGGN
ncbi:alpha/beta-hydrolase [Russula compacta]|nr:alpha/beta-hydrolase [Russula compacta]